VRDRPQVHRPHQPEPVELSSLLSSYEGLLLDAYGVLVDDSAALPGAPGLVSELIGRGYPFLIITNSASRTHDSMVRWLRELGLKIDPEHVLTSASLLSAYFRANDLIGSRCAVIGSEDSKQLVRGAGGIVEDDTFDAEIEALVVAGTPPSFTIAELDAVLAEICRRLDAGKTTHLILPNPDIAYPKPGGTIGLTAGALALMIEAALGARHGTHASSFVRLGKPHRPIFDEACRILGTKKVVVIGDQPATDIAGARNAGLDAALVLNGMWRHSVFTANDELRPNYLLSSLAI
jgi:HAD superfamily hydrolase (TIGR01450 family)